MKKGRMVIVAIVVIALVCGIFYYATWRKDHSVAGEGALTEVEKLITRNLDKKYPATPREVVKLYNRIIDTYYDAEYTEEQFEQLADQALSLMDDELRANNPKASYIASVKSDVEQFHTEKKTMTQYDVGDSNDVQYLKDENDELAFVEASYFVKENTSFSKTYQTYVLRKDSEGNWKILAFYQDDKALDEEED